MQSSNEMSYGSNVGPALCGRPRAEAPLRNNGTETIEGAVLRSDDERAPPALKSQSLFPVARSRTYRCPSLEPTKTLSPAISGEDSTRPRVAKVHRAFPVVRSRQ